ncbi:hypothetical protein CC86DRAFT_467860 [Ophiobolus disseminans]|uniref:Uncharacterized protein n=1 Tax=Ophiobolus disseminans TaxID=1469910 RepID=A0A6A6ZWG2_9PLEO|nr:hypothetical protein CC86DRAFT_467860 [Ophiobolus disseminans]
MSIDSIFTVRDVKNATEIKVFHIQSTDDDGTKIMKLFSVKEHFENIVLPGEEKLTYPDLPLAQITNTAWVPLEMLKAAHTQPFLNSEMSMEYLNQANPGSVFKAKELRKHMTILNLVDMKPEVLIAVVETYERGESEIEKMRSDIITFGHKTVGAVTYCITKTSLDGTSKKQPFVLPAKDFFPFPTRILRKINYMRGGMNFSPKPLEILPAATTGPSKKGGATSKKKRLAMMVGAIVFHVGQQAREHGLSVAAVVVSKDSSLIHYPGSIRGPPHEPPKSPGRSWHRSRDTLWQLVWFIAVPTYPFALLIDRATQTASMAFSKGQPQISLSYCVDSVLGLHVDIPETNGRTSSPLLSVPGKDLRVMPQKRGLLWIGRLVVLLCLMTQTVGTLILSGRKFYPNQMGKVDIRSAWTAFGGLLVVHVISVILVLRGTGNRWNSQMAPKGVSGVGKRVGRDETPSRAPRSRPQRRHMAPLTPISPEASQLSEQGVPFSQPAGVVQAALHGAPDDNDETDDEDLVEVVSPSGQRQKTPTSCNLQYAHCWEPARLPSEENERTVVKFNACWRVYFTPGPGRPHKPLPGWENSKSDTSQPLFRALNNWVKAVLAMQPSPMKQMDLAAVVYYQGQPKGEHLIESMYNFVALQRHTRFAAAMELVQEVAYEHPESPVLVDFDGLYKGDSAWNSGNVMHWVLACCYVRVREWRWTEYTVGARPKQARLPQGHVIYGTGT